jgi:hypothetical protein
MTLSVKALCAIGEAFLMETKTESKSTEHNEKLFSVSAALLVARLITGDWDGMDSD